MITRPISQRNLVRPLVTNVNECCIGRESLFVWENEGHMNKLCDQNTVKPVLNGISRDQNIFPLKPGFRLIKVHYIQYKKLNQDMQTLTLR